MTESTKYNDLTTEQVNKIKKAFRSYPYMRAIVVKNVSFMYKNGFVGTESNNTDIEMFRSLDDAYSYVDGKSIRNIESIKSLIAGDTGVALIYQDMEVYLRHHFLD
jgi:uncharacterized protein (UPF0333 family)